MTISRELGPNPLTMGQMFMNNQFKTKIPVPPQSNQLVGKTAIITGANGGLGFQCAKQLLGAGLSHLIIAVRSTNKGKSAAAQLKSFKAKIEVWEVDMADYDSIQYFSSRCNQLDRIDFVILNAGMATMSFEKAKTGQEMSIQVNYLSTVLLAVLLLPILKAKRSSNPAHLTVVSSATTRQVKFPNRDCRPLLESFKDVNVAPMGPERYGMSKLLGQMAFERIAKYVDPKDVIITLVEPGWVKQTGLNRNAPFALRMILVPVLAICGRPVDQGAATYFDAVVNQDQASHGSYIMNCSPAPYGDFVYLKEAQAVTEALWQETMAELEFANVRGKLEGMKP